ncbi:MAG TPA: NAD(P)H-dependent glycerol-3-phosphate dehydrogenase [Gammaproteobacteria bacterium]|nr:NAD(P)H-dependent glycerol-3-phosphate dehydrogenase [Gammaproteobacteria bacterium]
MIGVCGAGSWGTALAATLARNTEDDILIWGRESEVLREISTQHTNSKYLPGITLPHNIKGRANIEDLLNQVDDILIVVPSKAFVEVLQMLKPHLRPEQRIIWATKGLEPQRGRFLHEVCIDILGDQIKYAVLAGPSFATEVAKQLPTAVTIATKDAYFGKDLLMYFHSDLFRVYLSTDVIGAQVGGVIKNILAVAAGVSDGLGFGANARAALITRGLAEMMRFGISLGAQAETLQGLAGVGDVILSCTDNQSRNRRFGLALAAGQTMTQAQAEIGQVVEAVHNAAETCRIAEEKKIELPIAAQINKIFTEEVTPQQAVQNLITRKPAYER